VGGPTGVAAWHELGLEEDHQQAAVPVLGHLREKVCVGAQM
jgi:hypothetical protein